MRITRNFLAALLAVIAASSALPSSAQQFGESVIQRGTVTEDLYLAGGRVSVAANVAGDVTAAGARVTIEDSVDGDILIFGGSVDIRARIRDDARIGGGEINIRGNVGDDLLVAGGSVSIAPETVIGGRAWLAGGTLEINGRIGKGLKAAGGEIIIAGEILGDAELLGETIELRPGTRIHGQLNYRSPNPLKVSPDAEVRGSLTRLPFEMQRHEDRHGGARVFILLSLFTAAVVLWLLFPRFALATAQGVREAPWRSLGLGLAVLAGGPLLIVLLLASVVGLWLGLLTLILYMALLLLGYLTGILFVADAGLQQLRKQKPPTRGWTIAAIAVTLVVLTLLRLVPVIGGLTVFALLLFGLGALSHTLWRGYHDSKGNSKKGRRTRNRKARTSAR